MTDPFMRLRALPFPSVFLGISVLLRKAYFTPLSGFHEPCSLRT